jgi:hypothetical protein
MAMTSPHNSSQTILRIQNKTALDGTLVHSVGNDLKFSYRRWSISAQFNDSWRGDPPAVFMEGDESESALTQFVVKGKYPPLESLRFQYRQGDALIHSNQMSGMSLAVNRLDR